MKIKLVEQFISENPNPNLKEIFGHFQLDLESILITCVLLDIDYNEIKEKYDLSINSEYVLAYLMKEYLHDYKLARALIPISLDSALYIFSKIDYLDFGKNMIRLIKNKPNYLKEIKVSNIFENDIIMFSSLIDFKNNDFINIIKNRFYEQNIVFQDTSNEELFIYLSLKEFSVFSDININKYEERIKDIQSDLIYPMSIDMIAKINENTVLIEIDTNRIEQSIVSSIDNLDFKRLAKDFFSEFFSEIKEEIYENLVKYSVTQDWGLASVDIGIKAVKHIVLSISRQNSEILSLSIIQSNHESFKNSGKDSMRDWYISDLKHKIEEISNNLKNINLENLPASFFETHYQKFYSNYYFFYLNHPNSPYRGINQPVSVDENYIYSTVLDLINNQVISLNFNDKKLNF